MGYDTETNYNYLYFGQLNPHRIRFNFISQGLAFPKIDQNFNACELGFGNGLSIILHSAASIESWYGNDFNPSQVNYAKQLAKHGDVNANLSDDAFDEFLKRDDLPMFDYICLHGIWSWISPENQDVIVEFVKNKLKVGGILYISYNTKQVYSSIEPFRCIINSYIQNLGDPAKNNVQSIPDALAFVNKLVATKPGYTKHTPWALDRYTNNVIKQDQEYVGHEYANGYWLLQNFEQVAAKFEQAKLSYVCQAHLPDNLTDYFLSDEQKALYKQYVNTPLANEVLDFISENSFRSDIYVKGAVKLSTKQQLKELDDTYFICTRPIDGDDYQCKFRGRDHKIDLKRIEPIINIFKDNKCHSYKELRETLCSESNNKGNHAPAISEGELFSQVVYATACGMIFPATNPEFINEQMVERCIKLNKYILNGNQNESIMALASPVLGGGISIDDVDKVLMNLTLKLQDITPEVLAFAIKDILIDKNSDESEQAKIEEQAIIYATNFLNFKMPLYRTLMLV